MPGMAWEEFTGNPEWVTGERVLSPGDLDRFSELTGDLNPLHLDDGYAAAIGYRGRIAHGALGFSLALGLVNRLGLTAGTLIGLLGTAWRFEQPLYPGTTVRVRLGLLGRRPTSRPDRGIVELSAVLEDGNGVAYQRGQITLLVRRRQTAVADS
jgi:acyl dehydratase